MPPPLTPPPKVEGNTTFSCEKQCTLLPLGEGMGIGGILRNITNEVPTQQATGYLRS